MISLEQYFSTQYRGHTKEYLEIIICFLNDEQYTRVHVMRLTCVGSFHTEGVFLHTGYGYLRFLPWNKNSYRTNAILPRTSSNVIM